MTFPQQSGRRFGNLVDVEVRTLEDGSVRVAGHAAVFDSPTQIGPPGVGFEEVIARGAFKKTLADGADVRFLFNHNPDLVLARTKSGTLNLREDEVGLAVDAQLAPTSVGRDLAILLKRGDVDKMSFGFRVVKDQWETVRRDGDGGTFERRTVLEAQLMDVSGVTWPAYDETDLALREATLTRELRDARKSRTEPAPATRTVTTNSTNSTNWEIATNSTNWEIANNVFVGDNTETEAEPAEATPEKRTTEAEPAAATSSNPGATVRERDMPLYAILTAHANGGHSDVPRLLCPACSQPASATA